MNAQQFYASLQARGVRLVVDDSAPSGVKALAPPGVVTPQVAARIRAALPALLPLLDEGKAEESLQPEIPPVASTRPNPEPNPSDDTSAAENRRESAVESPLMLLEERLSWLGELIDLSVGLVERGYLPNDSARLSCGVTVIEPAQYLRLAAGRLAKTGHAARAVCCLGEHAYLPRFEETILCEAEHIRELARVLGGSHV